MAEFQFKLPDVGEGMHEGEIVKWLIKPGDPIEEDQIILEIQNDKSMVELPSPVTGKVGKIKVTEGTVATVGQLLATFEVEEGKGNSAASTVEKQPVPADTLNGSKDNTIDTEQQSKTADAQTIQESTSTQDKVAIAEALDKEMAPRQDPDPGEHSDPGQNPDKSIDRSTILATPSIRKFARENKVALHRIKGTGRSGQITKEDVLTYLDKSMLTTQGAATAAEQTKLSDTPNPSNASDAPDAPGVPNAVDAPNAPNVPNQTALPTAAPSNQTTIGGRVEERIPLTGIRKIIANAMVKSVYTAPHVTLMDEVEVSGLMGFREKAKPLAEQKGIKLTYLPFIVKALVAAAKQFPMINATIDEQTSEMVYKKYYHVGIATDTDNGLIVPVITDANSKSLFTIASEIKDLAARGRDGKLALSELKGSTITITNIGSAGGMFFTPVINFPEVAILGTGKISQKPVIKNGEIVIGQVMALSLSFDHRIIDGATAQYAMNYVKQLLEDPQLLLMEG